MLRQHILIPVTFGPIFNSHYHYPHVPLPSSCSCFPLWVLKKTSRLTFLVAVAEGVKIIAQQCYTPCWKALDASFQVITELFLCDQYSKIYQ